MVIEYIRVSKHEQNFDLQIDALNKGPFVHNGHGCATK